MKNQGMLISYSSLGNQVSSIGLERLYQTSFSLFNNKPYCYYPYSGSRTAISVIGDADSNNHMSVIGRKVWIIKGTVIKILGKVG